MVDADACEEPARELVPVVGVGGGVFLGERHAVEQADDARHVVAYAHGLEYRRVALLEEVHQVHPAQALVDDVLDRRGRVRERAGPHAVDVPDVVHVGHLVGVPQQGDDDGRVLDVAAVAVGHFFVHAAADELVVHEDDAFAPELDHLVDALGHAVAVGGGVPRAVLAEYGDAAAHDVGTRAPGFLREVGYEVGPSQVVVAVDEQCVFPRGCFDARAPRKPRAEVLFVLDYFYTRVGEIFFDGLFRVVRRAVEHNDQFDVLVRLREDAAQAFADVRPYVVSCYDYRYFHSFLSLCVC